MEVLLIREDNNFGAADPISAESIERTGHKVYVSRLNAEEEVGPTPPAGDFQLAGTPYTPEQGQITRDSRHPWTLIRETTFWDRSALSSTKRPNCNGDPPQNEGFSDPCL
jgi:hypothetical protein